VLYVLAETFYAALIMPWHFKR